MAFITKQISVDVASENIFHAIIAKQYDSDSRFLNVRLLNEGEQIAVDSTSTVLINARREDEGAKGFAGVVNEDGTVTVPIANWMLELDGQVECDISVIDSEQRKLTSTTFTIMVEPATYNGSDIAEDENYDVLTNLILECKEATAAASRVTISATEALETAYSNILKGRNLLQKTNRGTENWSFHSFLNEVDHTLEAETTEDGTNAVKLTVQEKVENWAVLAYSLEETLPKLKPNTSYVLSFDMKTDCPNSFSINICTVGSDGQLVTETFYGQPNSDQSWKHFVWRLTTNNLAKLQGSYWNDIILYFGFNEGVGYRTIKNLKLESGGNPTDWCPSPEDAIEAFTNLTQQTALAFDVVEQFVLANKPTAKVKTVTLLAANWIGDTSPYSQVVSIEGTTVNSKVDLNPTVEQLAIFHQKELAFVTENEDGVITVYAIGEKPQNDYTMPVTITEVLV